MLAAIAYPVFARKARGWAGYPLLKSLFTGGLILASSLLIQSSSLRPLLPLLGIGLLFTSNCLLIRSWSPVAEKGARRQAYACGLFVHTDIPAELLWQQLAVRGPYFSFRLTAGLKTRSLPDVAWSPQRETLAEQTFLGGLVFGRVLKKATG